MITSMRWRSLIAWIFVVAAMLAPLWTVVSAWAGGNPLAYALGGLFPLTDGALYWGCSLQLAALGSVPGPFGWVTFNSGGYCTNRPSHTGILATLQLLSGFDPQVLLVLLGLLIAIGMAFFALQVARTFGWVAGMLAYLLTFAYASQHALSMFTSESSGLFLGLLGLGLLVRFVRTDAWPDYWLGIAALSIGLFTRAGAMLALPFVFLWLLWRAAPLRGRRRYVFVATGACCIAAGFLLQRILLAAIGDPSSGYLSNFSVSLYGLATGSRDWREALVLFGVETPAPVETMNLVLPLAIKKVLEQPGTFLLALAGAERDFLATLFRVHPVEPIGHWLSVLTVMGAAGAALAWRRPGCQVLLIAALGEVLSAPFIFDAEGLRTFAASFPLRCLFAGIGASVLVRLSFAGPHRQSIRKAFDLALPPLPTATTTSARAALWPAAIALAAILVAAVFTATPLARPFRLDPVSVAGARCPDEAPPVVLVANRASTWLFIGGGPAVEKRAGRISVTSLEREIRDAWFREDFERLPHNTLLMRTIDRNPSNFGREISILWMNADPNVRDGDVLRFCLLPHLTRAPHRRFVRLAYHRFFLAVPAPSATPIPTSSVAGSRSP